MPDPLKRYLYTTHPDVMEAEQAYVAALEVFDATPAAERGAARLALAQATDRRVRARRDLDELLQHARPQGELLTLAGQLRKDRAEAEAWLRQTEARAPCDGVIDLLDLSKGQRVLPRLPVALISRAHEHECELRVRHASQWKSGMPVRGNLAGGLPLEASVDSLASTQLPASFKDGRDELDDTVVHLRIHSVKPIEPGAVARFPVP